MIPEIGHFALILCLALSIVQGVLPLVGDGIPQPLCFHLKGFHLRQQLRQRMQRLLAELGEADAEEYLRITERILSITQHMAQER